MGVELDGTAIDACRAERSRDATTPRDGPSHCILGCNALRDEQAFGICRRLALLPGRGTSTNAERHEASTWTGLHGALRKLFRFQRLLVGVNVPDQGGSPISR